MKKPSYFLRLMLLTALSASELTEFATVRAGVPDGGGLKRASDSFACGKTYLEREVGK
jgi:hypothetical protein